MGSAGRRNAEAVVDRDSASASIPRILLNPQNSIHGGVVLMLRFGGALDDAPGGVSQGESASSGRTRIPDT